MTLSHSSGPAWGVLRIKPTSRSCGRRTHRRERFPSATDPQRDTGSSSKESCCLSDFLTPPRTEKLKPWPVVLQVWSSQHTWRPRPAAVSCTSLCVWFSGPRKPAGRRHSQTTAEECFCHSTPGVPSRFHRRRCSWARDKRPQAGKLKHLSVSVCRLPV